MDSSPGFASAACDSNRPVQARFRCGSVSLNLAACRDSQAHSTKARGHRRQNGSRCLGAHGFRRCFTPSRGAFHLSLAVLVRYRSSESVQPWMVVPQASDRVSRARPYSGSRTASPGSSRTGLSPAAAGLPMPFRSNLVLRPGRQPRMRGPATPARRNGPSLCPPSTGLGIARFRSPLLARSRLISPPPGYLDVSVPRLSSRICVQACGSRP